MLKYIFLSKRFVISTDDILLFIQTKANNLYGQNIIIHKVKTIIKDKNVMRNWK